MAFCPNCGTPNTDQADKCVSCGFELVPKQKAKFKGTIMMSGIQVPGQAPNASAPKATAEAPSAAAPGPSAPPPSSPTPSAPAGGDRNLAFQKTMVGHAGMVPPSATAASDLAHAPTMQGQPPSAGGVRQPAAAKGGPSFQQPPAANSASFPTPPSGSSFPPRASSSASLDGFPASSANKPNPGKLLAIGCAAALLLVCLLVGLVWVLFGAKLKSLFRSEDTGAEAAAWQASIAQSLSQVAALCQSNCADAAVFFHPNVHESLADQAKALTEERVRAFGDPASSKAEMLFRTDDEEIAQKLGLDPQQCARVVAGAAKVVSCSVPEPDGKPSVLRIVHLSGIKTL